MQEPSLAEALTLFQQQAFFECHEVLEELWRPLAPGVEKRFLQGFIQLAVGMHHWRNHNLVGARNKLKEGLEKLDSIDKTSFQPIVALESISHQCRETLVEVEKRMQLK